MGGPLKELGKLMRKWQWTDIGRLGIAQEVLRKSTDFLRRIIAQVDGMGGVTLSYVCPHCNCFSMKDYIWWDSTGHGDRPQQKKKSAACGGQHDGERGGTDRCSTPMKRRCSKHSQNRWGCVAI